MRTKSLSIKQKLTRSTALTITISLLITSITLVVYDIISYRNALVRNLSILAGVIAENSRGALVFRDSSAAADTLASLKAQPRIASACVYGPEGTVFAEYRSSSSNGEGASCPAGALDIGHRFSFDYVVLFEPVILEGENVGTVYIQSDLGELYARLTTFGATVLIILTISSGVVLALSTRFQRLVTDPILHLVTLTRVVSEKKIYSVRAKKHSEDEIGVLIEAFNEMLTAIQDRDVQLMAAREQAEAATEQAKLASRTKSEFFKRALAKEKELNKLQRQFVSMASHEFRTPLAIIDSTAQRLKRRGDRLTPEEVTKRVGTIRDAVKRMARLIDSTLTAARMEEGKIAVEIRTCNLGRLLRQVCARQQEMDQTHIITCKMVDLPATIQADSGALEQVFTNLLSNAVKYAPGAPEIDVVARGEGGEVVISVRDRGLGIDEEDLPQMFERFFRAKTSTGIVGTGIGLNLVKNLVEMHGGSVAIESKKGEGCTLTVRLPVDGPEETEELDSQAA